MNHNTRKIARKLGIVMIALAAIFGMVAMGGVTAEETTEEHTVLEGESIQDAIDNASANDTIVLESNVTYEQDINITTDELTFESDGTEDATVTGYVDNPDDYTYELDGVVFTGGGDTDGGGGGDVDDEDTWYEATYFYVPVWGWVIAILAILFGAYRSSE